MPETMNSSLKQLKVDAERMASKTARRRLWSANVYRKMVRILCPPISCTCLGRIGTMLVRMSRAWI